MKFTTVAAALDSLGFVAARPFASTLFRREGPAKGAVSYWSGAMRNPAEQSTVSWKHDADHLRLSKADAKKWENLVCKAATEAGCRTAKIMDFPHAGNWGNDAVMEERHGKHVHVTTDMGHVRFRVFGDGSASHMVGPGRFEYVPVGPISPMHDDKPGALHGLW